MQIIRLKGVGVRTIKFHETHYLVRHLVHTSWYTMACDYQLSRCGAGDSAGDLSRQEEGSEREKLTCAAQIYREWWEYGKINGR